jgi:hypothetical protein
LEMISLSYDEVDHLHPLSKLPWRIVAAPPPS